MAAFYDRVHQREGEQREGGGRREQASSSSSEAEADFLLIEFVSGVRKLPLFLHLSINDHTSLRTDRSNLSAEIKGVSVEPFPSAQRSGSQISNLVVTVGIYLQK